jgi:hypothetical protein
MTVAILRHLNLKMIIPCSPVLKDAGEQVATIIWARKIKDDIYQLSLAVDGGTTSYYAKAKKEGGFELLEAANVNSEIANALRAITPPS